MSEIKSFRLDEKDLERLEVVGNWLKENGIEFDNKTQVLKTALNFASRYVLEQK